MSIVRKSCEEGKMWGFFFRLLNCEVYRILYHSFNNVHEEKLTNQELIIYRISNVLVHICVNSLD